MDFVRIGSGHAAQVEAMRVQMRRALEVCPPDLVPMLSDQEERLAGWTARVAAIGQVKAGKSTFLSALIGRPGFLPSEVNPWTTVVTHLHFGNPAEPTSGGVFRFFGEETWQRILNGDDDTRKLAEELLPGFRGEVLKQQVEDMRARAEERLGRYYHAILGRDHSYDVVTPQILARYVCAGTEKRGAMQSLGRYSEITERADIYFPADGITATPLILSDTPGVNDPFLVRDELTCRSLTEADIFVVVLSAHQPLTEVDIALMRMLAAHSGKQIIVLINRIDELESYDDEVPRLKADVRARLSETMEADRFEIVAGSAFWGECVTAPDADHAFIEEIVNTPAMDRYLAENHPNAPAKPIDRLRLASGLVSIREAISRSVDGTVGERVRTGAREELRGALQTMAGALSRRKRELADAVAGRTTSSDGLASWLSARSAEAERVGAEVEKLFADAAAEIHSAVETSWGSLRRDLETVCDSFTDGEVRTLTEVLTSEGREPSYEFSTLKLQKELEDAATEGYLAARDRLDARLTGALDAARRLVEPVAGEVGLDAGLSTLPHDEIAPIVRFSQQSMTLELGGRRGWLFWRKARLSSAEATDTLRRMINAEVYPAVEQLSHTTHEGLVERATAALRRLKTLSSLALSALKPETLVDLRDGPLDEATLARLRRSIEAELQDTARRIRTLEEVDRVLRSDDGKIDAKIQGAA